MLQRRLSPQRIAQWAGLAAIPLILLLVSLILGREFEQSRALTADVARSYETKAQLQHILSSYQDMETGQRGFVITGDMSFLQPYEAARGRLNAELAWFERLETNDPMVRRNLPALLSLSRQKTAFMQRTIELRRTGDAQGAMRLIASRRAAIARMTSQAATTSRRMRLAWSA